MSLSLQGILAGAGISAAGLLAGIYIGRLLERNRPRREEETLSQDEGLALLWYVLFGPEADQPIDRGGYIRWCRSKALGVLRQVDERLVRCERELRLPEMRFTLNADGEEGAE